MFCYTENKEGLMEKNTTINLSGNFSKVQS